jgi:hypothetical protein
MRLVRSNRSNPALKQVLTKARFFKKEYYPDEKDSARSQVVGGDCFLKTCGQPQCNGAQTLLLTKTVKTFATDKDEGVLPSRNYKVTLIKIPLS